MANYQRLASMVAAHSEAAIFRRFDALHVKSLLYMQAEIDLLDNELRLIESEEASLANAQGPTHPFSVYELKESATRKKVSQWTKYQEIQSRLESYSMLYGLKTHKDYINYEI